MRLEKWNPVQLDEESASSNVPQSVKKTDLWESLFKARHAIEHHRAAPLSQERRSYLLHLLQQGKGKKSARDTAAVLLHVVRVLNMHVCLKFCAVEIRTAAEVWARESLPHRKRSSDKSVHIFVTAANGFLKFHGLIVAPHSPACRFQFALTAFRNSLINSGYLATTVVALTSPMKRFLHWVTRRHESLSDISFRDIDDYLEMGRDSGLRPRTTVAHCQALRTFFRFAEAQGWSSKDLSRTIVPPIIRKQEWEVRAPCWEDVRRCIKMTGNGSISDCRAKAILLLCSIYGLRSSEVCGLTLESFDWQAESFTLKRAKNGPWQRLPIQWEVGQAIIDYLRAGRPRSACRNLFVTLCAPYRRLQNLGPIVHKQMKLAGLSSQGRGPHSLRHACATELLKRGTALQKIADLLGHRDLRSVSTYAKSDFLSLRAVADFSLWNVK